jgi:hypothetical protein
MFQGSFPQRELGSVDAAADAAPTPHGSPRFWVRPDATVCS